MDNLTLAQQNAMDKRAKRSKTVDSGASAPETVPVPLKIMLRQGEVIEVEGLGGKTLKLEIGRILIKHQEEYEELASSFDLMLLMALANSYDEETEEYDMDRMAFIVNTVFRVGAQLTSEDPAGTSEAAPKPPTYTPAECAGQVEIFTSRPFASDTKERMTLLVALVLSRKHPEIDAEAVDEWLDLTSFLAILRAFYRTNHGVRERF